MRFSPHPLLVPKLMCNFAVEYKCVGMKYTAETLVVSNPSKRVLNALDRIQERKRAQVERLRRMKPEDFSCRIFV